MHLDEPVALRAPPNVAPADREQQLDPRRRERRPVDDGLRPEQLACSFEARADVRRRAEAVVTDLDVALGQDVLDEAREEIGGLERSRELTRVCSREMVRVSG